MRKTNSPNGAAATFYLESGLHARIKSHVYALPIKNSEKPSVSGFVSDLLAAAMAKIDERKRIKGAA